MLKIIENEFIKIVKRKNIYILLVIATLIMLGYNLFQKIMNIEGNITSQYEHAYFQDNYYLENYETLTLDEKYETILERVNLEKYALEHNIKYNILLNPGNTQLPLDARIMIMKVFDNFEIITLFIIIYVATTSFSEEYNKGTIKGLLTKPHKRVSIVFAKIITNIIISLIIVSIIVILQYFIGGAIFGFDSYELEAIRYNSIKQDIETMNLWNYMLLIFVCKIPMYIILNLIGLLIGVITDNMAMNILISLGLYMMSKIETSWNLITRYFITYNWDLSKFLFGELENTILTEPIIISVIYGIGIVSALSIIFTRKDIKNT